MLFKEKQVNFETLAMRDQHSCSGSLKYDEQSLVDFRNLIAGNKDIFSALLTSFTPRVLSQEETLRTTALLDRLRTEILPIIESTRKMSRLSNLGVITSELNLLEEAGGDVASSSWSLK